MVGQFFTPDLVARAMLRLARVRPSQRIIDPSCGDGAFLRNIPRGCVTFACEIDRKYRQVIESLVERERLVMGDALTELVPLWGTFDLVVGNPPFSAQTHLERRSQVLQGFDLGSGKGSQCLEILFLELFLKLAKPRGRIAIILPDGPLSNRPFAFVRNWLLRRAHVEAIVSLPRNTFNFTTAKTNILIARRLAPVNHVYREPTWLRVCEDLAELDEVDRVALRRDGHQSRCAVLAELDDWRPEAQPGQVDRGDSEDSLRLGDVFRLRTGFALYGEKRMLFSRPAADRLLLLRAKNLFPEGGLRLHDDMAYISSRGPMFREEAVLREGEIVFVRVGSGCYGRAALVPLGVEAQADDWMHVLTAVMNVDLPGFVAWLNSSQGRAQIRRLAKGVGTLSVSKASLAEMKIPARFVKSELVLQEPAGPYENIKPRSAARRAI